MNNLKKTVTALENGRAAYEKLNNEASEKDCFFAQEEYGTSFNGRCRIAQGDNLEYMMALKKRGMEGTFQFIYTDPPFFSGGKYQASFYLNSPVLGKSPLIKAEAYDDSWSGDLYEYLEMITVRLLMMRDLLSETGCIAIHLDWHAVHYVKLIMDEIFDEGTFVNEIIWTYKSGGSGKKSFAKKHDTILVYSKSSSYVFNPLKEKSYNRNFKPYRFKGVEEYEDEIGWYTLVNMKDVWSVDMVGRTSAERTGYATQKPEKLMARLIEAFSNEGDLCGDFFAGSGSFGTTCQRLGRDWVMCDKGGIAISDQTLRILSTGGSFSVERQKIEDDNFANIKVELKEKSLEILDYHMPKAAAGFYGETVLNYIKKDALSLIKIWSVDSSYDGKVHRTRKVYDGSIRNVKLIDKESNVSVVGYDYLGNIFRYKG